MVKIEDPRRKLADRIFSAYVANREDWRREHLGASLLGRECAREVWMKFRWWAAPDHPGRLLRLFERGNREEAWIADDLRAAGLEVLEVDPETGKQFEFARYGGHLGGSGDLLVRNVPDGGKAEHVGECKTHSDKSFKDLVRNGVEKSKPEHFVQTQLYMHWWGKTRALYIAVNKNTDEIYIERIKYDAKVAERYEERGRSIIFDRGMPPKVSEKPSFFKCKFCDFRDECHYGAPPEKNCRTCAFSQPREDGTWRCTKSRRAFDSEDPVLDVERQKAGCDEWHQYGVELEPGEEPVAPDPALSEAPPAWLTGGGDA